MSVTPVNGGPTKKLFDLPKGIYPPIAIDLNDGKMYAYTYILNFASQRDPAIVSMDLYTGTNVTFVKNIDPNYNGLSMTALTIDERTGALYYTRKTALSLYWNPKSLIRSILVDIQYGKQSLLESYNPRTNTTNRLWQSNKLLSVTDIKLNGTLLIMSGKFHSSLWGPLILTRVKSASYANDQVYDLVTGTMTVLNSTSKAVAPDSKSSTLYVGSGTIRSVSELTRGIQLGHIFC
jgi:hypothetical protein